MKIRALRIYAIPGKIVLLRGQIAAFVEIAPDRSGRRKLREEQPQQLKRQLICHVPAISGPRALCVQTSGPVRKQEPHPVLPSGSKAEIEAEVGIQLDIQYRASCAAALRNSSRQLS